MSFSNHIETNRNVKYFSCFVGVSREVRGSYCFGVIFWVLDQTHDYVTQNVRPKGVESGAEFALLLIGDRGVRKIPHFVLSLPSKDSDNAGR
jgi:hypothetical protein